MDSETMVNVKQTEVRGWEKRKQSKTSRAPCGEKSSVIGTWMLERNTGT